MSVLTAQGISDVAIELLVQRLSLPRTVTMVPGSDFNGSNGDTITVRVPQPGAARTQANPGDALTADDVTEVGIDVQLSYLYHLKNVNDQELDLQLEDFTRQITRVQVEAVAVGAEKEITDVMNALAGDATIQWATSATDDDTVTQILAARQALSEANCPPDGRFLAVAPDIATRILGVDLFTKANESGSAEALRNAVLGRLFGFTIVESNGLTDGTAVAYHKSGFCFATKVPQNPRGAASSGATIAQGIGLRQVFQYAATNARDQSLVSTYAGAAAVYENEAETTIKRFVKIPTAT